MVEAYTIFDYPGLQRAMDRHVQFGNYNITSKIMQKVVTFLESSPDDWIVSLKAGNMSFNRFCIDEDAAFESAGVYYLKESSLSMAYGP